MTYKPVHAWKRKDKLPSKDPQKIIYGSQLQDEFDAISEGVEGLDGQIEDIKIEIDSLGGNSGGGGTGGDYDDSQIKAELASETQARIAGDADLQTQIDNLPSGGGGASSWDELTGKPTEFPPEDHTHVVADITDFNPADYQPVGDYIGEAPNDGKQYVRESENWAEVAIPDSGAPTMHVGDTAPADPVEGQQWLNTDDGYLYVYYDNSGSPTWMAVERQS